jgi:hypothetical protein
MIVTLKVRRSSVADDLETQENPGLGSMVVYCCLSALLSAQTHGGTPPARQFEWLKLSA